MQQRTGVAQLILHIHRLVAKLAIRDHWQRKLLGVRIRKTRIALVRPLHRCAHPIAIMQPNIIAHADLIPVIQHRGTGQAQQQISEQLQLR